MFTHCASRWWILQLLFILATGNMSLKQLQRIGDTYAGERIIVTFEVPGEARWHCGLYWIDDSGVVGRAREKKSVLPPFTRTYFLFYFNLFVLTTRAANPRFCSYSCVKGLCYDHTSAALMNPRAYWWLCTLAIRSQKVFL